MVSRKIIKKLVKTTAILLLLFFALPATAFLLLQSSSIQTYLAGRIMETVSGNLGTRFSISRIDISFLYRIRLNDVYLEDLSGDTLLYVESLTAGLRKINPIRQEISIGSVNFDEALVSFKIDSSGNLNLRYFIDKLQGNGQGKGGWDVKFSNLKMRDGRFCLKSYYHKPVEYGMNYTDLDISDIDADIKRFSPTRDSLSFYIKSLTLKEKCGLSVRQFSGDFSESKTFLSFRKVKILTEDSELKGNEISLRFRDWEQFKPDSFHRFVRMRIDLQNSRINLHDVGYFAPVFRNANQLLAISGQVSGPVNNLKGKGLEIGYGSNSTFAGELNFEGLPHIRETFILADISELTTSALDINNFQRGFAQNINLPEQIEKLGSITYKGNFTGFINDFVAYGKFSTALGIVNTDLLFRPDTSNYLDFEGRLNAQDFDLGYLLDASKNVGRISVSASVNGAMQAGKSIHASLKGLIERFEFRQYEYTNIRLAGNLENKTYNGSINIHDPNIELEFLGKVNLSDSVAVFDFTANITDANLYALNIEKSDPDFRASCYLIANARGNSINSLNGEVKILNSLFSKKEKQLQVYDFIINAENISGSNSIHLRSDFLDADMTGNYELTRIGETARLFLLSYLPSLGDSSMVNTEMPKHNLRFEATVKNVKPLLDFFLPEYGIAENTKLTLGYQPENKQFQLFLISSQIRAKGILWNDLNILFDGNPDSLKIDAGSNNLAWGNRIKLENFTLMTNVGKDAANMKMRWNNWQDLQYKGNIDASAIISRNPGSHYPHIEISLNPATIVTNDTV